MGEDIVRTNRNIGLIPNVGFGSKASLSLRNDYYDVTTAHNGKLFKFRAHAYAIDSLIGKFDSNGEINNSVEWQDSKGNVSTIYYEKTTEKNFTELSIPCKTYHRTKIQDAVDSQLLYLSGIKFEFIDEYGNKTQKSFQANILYNSKNLIISDQRTYSKPHVIIVKDIDQPAGVCYGYVNFHELEMQDLYSYVGFKCPMRQVIRDNNGKEIVIQDGVDISPSRESIIWTDNTRNYLQGIIDGAIKEAEELINKQLEEPNLLKWIEKAVSIKSGNTSDWTLSNISKIVDTTNVLPTFSSNNKIKLKGVSEFWAGFFIRVVEQENKYVRNKGYQNYITRTHLSSWNSWQSTVVFHDDKMSSTKDEYILKTRTGHQRYSRFIAIKKLTDEALLAELFEGKDFSRPRTHFCKSEKDFEKVKETRDFIYKAITEDPNSIDYDKLVVPDNFKGSSVDEETLEEEATDPIHNPYAGMTPAEIRKLQDKMVVQHPNLNLSGNYINPNQTIKYSKQEMVIDDFINDKSNVYYALGTEEQSLTTIAALISSEIGKARFFDSDDMTKKVFNSEIKILRLPSNTGKKYLKNHRHINQFFGYKPLYTEKDTQINMDERLVKWNTCRLIFKELQQMGYFENFEQINSDLRDIYLELKRYANTYYELDSYSAKKALIDSGTFDAFTGYMSKVTEFSLFKEDNSGSPEAIKAKSLELFGVETIEEVKAVNFDIYNKFRALKEYSSQVGVLLNAVDFDLLTIDGYAVLNKLLHVYNLDQFNLSDFNVVIQTPDFQQDLDTDAEVEETEEIEAF